MSRHTTIHGAFEIDSLPGQSQVAVCHSFVVVEEHRGRGHAHGLKERQNIELAVHHYDYGICTVASGNQAQKAVLAKAGWKRLDTFRNRRSCEDTELWGFHP